MKKRHKVLITLFAVCLWGFMIACHLADKQTVKYPLVAIRDSTSTNLPCQPPVITRDTEVYFDVDTTIAYFGEQGLDIIDKSTGCIVSATYQYPMFVYPIYNHSEIPSEIHQSSPTHPNQVLRQGGTPTFQPIEPRFIDN